jgi:hypothetical protein
MLNFIPKDGTKNVAHVYCTLKISIFQDYGLFGGKVPFLTVT